MSTVCAPPDAPPSRQSRRDICPPVSFGRPAVIIGNGPSLREFDLKTNLRGYATFGMNAAYKYWDAIGWYPEYYSCLDPAVGMSHITPIKRMIKQAARLGIQKFLLRDCVIKKLGSLKAHPAVDNFDTMQGRSFFKTPERLITTGSHTCAWAATLGYRDIILLGVDSRYVRKIKEAHPVDDLVLEIVEEPVDNPNYFFEGYQNKGDRYQIPTPQSGADESVHCLSWRHVCQNLKPIGVVIVNATPLSQLEVIPKVSFNDAIPFIYTLRQQTTSL